MSVNCRSCAAVDQYIANGNLRVRRRAERRTPELARAPFGADTASRHEVAALREAPDDSPLVGPPPSRRPGSLAAG